MRIGIMQGRLLPPVDGAIQRFPRDQWPEEFPLAAEAGLSSIEWIYEVYGKEINPLGSNEGIERIRTFADRYSVAVESVCADYFMDNPFLRVTPSVCKERTAVLEWLIGQCGKLGVNRIILPFVDASKIQNANEMRQVAAVLQSVLSIAEKASIELHLETSLPPKDFAELLATMPHSAIMVNYDSGNSASLGYDPREEFAAYGGRIGSVHIKDRLRDGGTVPLGTGAARLEELFRLLRGTRYNRGFILQVARGLSGDEVTLARRNRALVEELWDKSAILTA